MARRQLKRINVERVMFPGECFLWTLAILLRRVLINEINSNLIAKAFAGFDRTTNSFQSVFARLYIKYIYTKILCVEDRLVISMKKSVNINLDVYD